jgi:hypothetical protein
MSIPAASKNFELSESQIIEVIKKEKIMKRFNMTSDEFESCSKHDLKLFKEIEMMSRDALYQNGKGSELNDVLLSKTMHILINTTYVVEFFKESKSPWPYETDRTMLEFLLMAFEASKR